MISPTDLLHSSPAPHFKIFQVFLIASDMQIILHLITPDMLLANGEKIVCGNLDYITMMDRLN
jgi:hypothetical protein